MVSLDTIFEVDAIDDDALSFIADQSSLKSKLERFQDALPHVIGKKIEDFSLTAQAAERLELLEPECELDPCCTEASQWSAMANSDQPKRSGRQHSGLIDQAFKLQQQPQPQETHEESRQQMDPAYIGISDLAADWSRCFTNYVTRSSLEPVCVNLLVDIVGVHEVALKTKRKRKKSLIDKAASQQRRELEEATGSQAQLQQKGTSKVVNTCCSLRETRMANGSDNTLIPLDMHLISGCIPSVESFRC